QGLTILGGNIDYYKQVHFEGQLSFKGAIFESGSILRIFRINANSPGKGIIDFRNALVKGLIDIRQVALEKISFEGAVVTGNIQDNGSISSAIEDVASARLLKHESRKINNHLSALRYYQLEMHLYAKTLNWKRGDWYILGLNRLSNQFGLSWTRAVVFTLSSALLCYTLFTCFAHGLYQVTVDQYFAGLINYFWLPMGFNELVDPQHPVHVTGGFAGALFFILGKILIAYGIYQTIAAFRKHIQ
ncbi:MAG: hypothetical protein ACTHNW_06500, partial [Mucilaginibacter sp.]